MCRVHELISCTSKEERAAAAKEKRQKVKQQKQAAKRKASPKAKQAAKAKLKLKPSAKTKPCLTKKPSFLKKSKGKFLKRTLATKEESKAAFKETVRVKQQREGMLRKIGRQCKSLGEAAAKAGIASKKARSDPFTTPSPKKPFADSPDPAAAVADQLSEEKAQFLQKASESILQLEAAHLQAGRAERRAVQKEAGNVALKKVRDAAAKEQAKTVQAALHEAGKMTKLLQGEAEPLLDQLAQAEEAKPPPLPPPSQPPSEAEQDEPKQLAATTGAAASAAAGAAPAASTGEAAPASEPAAPASAPAAAGSVAVFTSMAAQLSPEPAPQAGDSIFVIVAGEDAEPHLRGLKGIRQSVADGTVIFLTFGGQPVEAPESVCEIIIESQAKRRFSPTKRSCNYVTPELAFKITQSLSFAITGDHLLPGIELAQDHIDIGVAEILWRILPGEGFVVAGANLAATIHAAKHGKLAEQDEEGFGQNVEAQLLSYASKAKVLLVPILAGGHWTLLACERHFTDEDEKKTSAAINAHGSSNADVRKAAEQSQFDLDKHPNLMLKDCFWSVRYYDTYPKLIKSCKAVAQTCLTVLAAQGVPDFDLKPVNTSLQEDNNSCGHWILHYIEEEARARLDEHRGTMTMDLGYRRDRVNHMSHFLAVKALSSACLSMEA